MLFSKKHKIGDAISKLRKEKGWTQVELANKLKVSDKAVSKWESNRGEPSIEFLPKLAQLFDVSLDFLMTGKEKEDKIITVNKLELAAKEDNVEMYKGLNLDIDYKDENRKTIFHYVFDYESKNLFAYLIKNNQIDIFIEHYGDDSNIMEKFFYMAILCNDESIINELVKLEYINAKTNNTGLDDRVYRYINYKNTNLKIIRKCLSERIIDKIVYDKNLNKKIREAMIPNEVYASTIFPISFPYIIYYVITKKDYKLTLDLLKKALEYNKKQAEKDKIYYSYSMGSLYYYTNYVNLPKEIFIQLLEDEQYQLLDIANEVNTKNINHRPKLFQISSYDIEANKIKHNNKLSKKEKELQLCIHDGIICLDELIALNDYDLYEKTLEKYPANEYEVIFKAIYDKDYRKIFEYAVQQSITNIIDDIRNKKLDSIKNHFCDYISSKHASSYGCDGIILSNGINKDYYTITKEKYHSMLNRITYQTFINMRNKVFLLKVLDKDIRFIEKACKTATPKELDEALIKIEPNNFKVIKILLDAGAKLHKEWYDEEGYSHDEIDKIGTEILKKKIDDLLVEGR